MKTIDVKVRVQTSKLLRSLSHQFRNYLKTEKEKSQVRARRGVSRRRVKPQFSEPPSFFLLNGERSDYPHEEKNQAADNSESNKLGELTQYVNKESPSLEVCPSC